MKGFIKKAVAGLCLGTGALALVGCNHYRNIVDPCWPERYNAEARMNLRDTFAAQAHNGHVLDQTVWNHHFEVDPKSGEPTDKLNPGGMEHLKYLARRGPAPDPQVYLQTAQALPMAQAQTPEKMALARSDLDNKRVAAVQRYLATTMSGRAQPVEFNVAVHDPAEVGIAAVSIGGNKKNPEVIGAIPLLWNTFRGKLAGVDSVTMTTGGGGG